VPEAEKRARTILPHDVFVSLLAAAPVNPFSRFCCLVIPDLRSLCVTITIHSTLIVVLRLGGGAGDATFAGGTMIHAFECICVPGMFHNAVPVHQFALYGFSNKTLYSLSSLALLPLFSLLRWLIFAPV